MGSGGDINGWSRSVVERRVCLQVLLLVASASSLSMLSMQLQAREGCQGLSVTPRAGSLLQLIG